MDVKVMNDIMKVVIKQARGEALGSDEQALLSWGDPDGKIRRAYDGRG